MHQKDTKHQHLLSIKINLRRTYVFNKTADFKRKLNLMRSQYLRILCLQRIPAFGFLEQKRADFTTSYYLTIRGIFIHYKMLTFAQGSLSSEQPLGNPLQPIPDQTIENTQPLYNMLYMTFTVFSKSQIAEPI